MQRSRKREGSMIFGSRLLKKKKILKEIGVQDLSFHSLHAHFQPIVQQGSEAVY